MLVQFQCILKFWSNKDFLLEHQAVLMASFVPLRGLLKTICKMKIAAVLG